MKIYLGESGLDNSWQDRFPRTTKCYKCKKVAKIMFVGFEKEPYPEKGYICKLHATTGKKGGLWLHDACAIAVYLCPYCFETTSILNQA